MNGNTQDCLKTAPHGVAGAWILGAALAAAALCGPVRPARGAAAPASDAPQSAVSQVVELHLDDQVDPILAEYIVGGIEEADRRKASLVLITMDTPGGLSTSMEDIIAHILSSPVPVAVYVSPVGARGASAGFFILESADIAAMAPGTHTGAASPLLEIGGVPLQMDETLKRKILNDATAYLRSYSGKRGRNVTLAETAVVDGKAWTETEAVDGKLADLIAKSREDLFAQLDGRTITRFDGTTTKLALRDPLVTELNMSAREKFLARIAQPDIFFVLLICGVLGLYVEFTHPGMIAPGVIGGIALILALYDMNILPVQPAGLLLIVLALALFVLEAKYTSHGVLAAGGIVAMLLGALMLIRSPLTGAGVSLGVALGVTLPFALISVFLMRLVLRSRKWKPETGIEQLSGAEAEVTEPLAATGDGGGFQGMVRLHGELWRAIAPEAIPAGAHVRVVRTEGLTVHVVPAERGAMMAK